MIERSLKPTIQKRLFAGKAILITGPRQVGKTTLIKAILEDQKSSILFLDGDDPTIRTLLDGPNTEQIKQLLGDHTLIFIDEAQRIQNIGITSKIIIDQFKDKQLIISGSSSFELTQKTNEPLTGRKWSYNLWPISWEEWQNYLGYVKAEQDLETRLIYGFYPDILTHPEDQREILLELVESYLYKDILTYAGIRKPQIIQKLVQALAHQVGQEVVYKEIGDLIGLDPKTVNHYIDILEKAFVIFRLPAFGRNLRNEIKTNRKVYFYDNGVRNAVMGAFQPLPSRQDTGALWENFLISERVKQLNYHKLPAQMYFWRTKQQQEIDYLEERDGKIYAFEFKWGTKKKIRFPKTFTENYDTEAKGINRENFRDFVVMEG